MRSQDAPDLEDLSFDETPDIMSAMVLPDLRRYVEEDTYDDEEHGLRSLLEHPEALSGSFRCHLQDGPGWRAASGLYASQNRMRFASPRKTMTRRRFS
jgi:hypothetical protein